MRGEYDPWIVFCLLGCTISSNLNKSEEAKHEADLCMVQKSDEGRPGKKRVPRDLQEMCQADAASGEDGAVGKRQEIDAKPFAAARVILGFLFVFPERFPSSWFSFRRFARIGSP
jgi:hypothetical protein